MTFRPRARLTLVAIALLVLLPGCAGMLVDVDGPQLASPPEGLGFDLNCQAWSWSAGPHAVTRQRCYAAPSQRSPGTVIITQRSGEIDKSESQAWHQKDLALQRGSGVEWSTPEDVTVDGASGWIAIASKGTATVEGVVWVAEAGSTYTIDFAPYRPDWQQEAYVRHVLLSFSHERPGRRSRPVLLALAVLVLAGLGWFFTKRHREEAARREREERFRAEAERRRAERRVPPPSGAGSDPASPPPS